MTHDGGATWRQKVGLGGPSRPIPLVSDPNRLLNLINSCIEVDTAHAGCFRYACSFVWVYVTNGTDVWQEKASSSNITMCGLPTTLPNATAVNVVAGTGHVVSLGPDGPLLMTSDVRFDGDPKNSIAAWISRDGGWAWSFAGLVARGTGWPSNWDGPSEADVVMLPDAEHAMVVFRVQSYHPYRMSTASIADLLGGATTPAWSTPVAMNGTEPADGVVPDPSPKSVRPKLHRLGDIVVLVGGRPSLFAWTQDWSSWTEGPPPPWELVNLGMIHNNMTGNAGLRYTDTFVRGGVLAPKMTTGYTSVFSWDGAAVVVYDRLSNGHAIPTSW